MKYLFVGLSKLVSYDPVEDKDAIAQEKRKLDQGVQQTQDKIVELVKKNRREFYRRASINHFQNNRKIK